MVRLSLRSPGMATKLAILVFLICGAIQAQTLTANPTQLTFVHQVGNPQPLGQNVAVGGTSGLNTTITTSYPAPAPPSNWLQPFPNIGTTPYTVGVFVLPAGLQPGTYFGTLTIGATGVNPATVTVQLIVSNQPLVSVTPSSMNFAYALNGPEPAAQTLNVNSTTAGIGFSAAASTTSGVPWLSVTPTTGTTPATLTVSVNRTGLTVGTHTGAVTIAAAGAGNPQVTVQVTFVITDEIRLAAIPDQLQFDFQLAGPNPPTRVVSISSSGVPVPFTSAVEVTGGGAWLSATPTSGNTPVNLSVSVLPTGLAAGTYTGRIRITSGPATNSPLEIPVTFRVTADPVLQLHPGNFAFTIQAGAASTTQTQVAVLSNLGAPLAFTTAATTATGGNWLTVVATGAATPSAIHVRANAQGLAAGTYQGQIAITAAGAANSPLNVPVTLVVTTTPGLRVSRRFFNFAFQTAQQAPAAQTFQVTSTGADVAFTTTAATDGGGNWLVAQQVAAATPSAVNLSVNPAGLAPGLYTGTVSVVTTQEGATPLTIQVRLVVSDTPLLVVSNAPLTFSFSAGAGQPENQTITVTSTGTPLNFLEEDTTSGGGDWLVVGPAAGVTPANLGVGVNTALPLGNYTGVIRVSADGAANSPQFIPVLYSVTTSAELAITPGILTFTHQIGGQAAAPQSLTVASTGAIQNFAVQVTANGGNWLSVAPTGGITPQNLTATVNAAGLEPGTYGGAITITSPTATNSPRIIPVTLTVTRALPQILVSQASLTFNHTPGASPPAAQTVQATSSGEVINFTTSVTTSNGTGWLSVSPASGATPAALTISVTPTGLTGGTYTGTVTLTSAGAANSPRTINVTLVVAAVTAPQLTAFVHAATFLPVPAVPGLIVTVGGTNIGPENLIGITLTPQGDVATMTGDTRLLFDGIPGAMIYASSRQTSAVIPYQVGGRVSVRVQVEYRGVLSNPIELRVVDAAPGIFTQSASGTGLGAILNQDNSVNSLSNGAARGSVIVAYASGEGETSPPGVNGQVTGSVLKRPLLQVRARIGGFDCEVAYAGSAPGFVSGALQVNIIVNPNIPPGTHPIDISVGSFTSQPGVTVVIR